MALHPTNLFIQSAPIPATFTGTPDEFRQELVKRLKIVSPAGTTFISLSDTEPVANVGPWLKGGTQWYVWNEATKRYVPLDISASETQWYWIGPATPPTTEPPVWFRTERLATEDDPFWGDSVGWYSFTGTAWLPVSPRVQAGTTANRPASPFELQPYYDSDIECLIWFERGAWRTMAGTPGDIKFVAFDTLAEALQFNPGWDVFGRSTQTLRGRVLTQATKDAGATPAASFPTDTNVAERAAFEVFGEGEQLTPSGASAVTIPPQLALWCLVKL